MSKANSENVSVRSLLETFVSGAVTVNAEMQKLQEKRSGTYTNGVQAAILAGNKADFEKEVSAFMDDIRANKGGYARKLGCKVAKRQPKGQPKNRPVYVVPSSVSALKTYMSQALEFEVPLTEDESGEPRAYTAIRGDVQAIKAEQAKNALTGDAAIRQEIIDNMDAIESRLDVIDGDPLVKVRSHILDALTAARDASGIDAKRKAQKAKNAAKKAAAKTETKSKPAGNKAAVNKAAKKKAAAKKASKKAPAKKKADNAELAKAA